MSTYFLLLILPWALVSVITPIGIRWATRHGWVDRPTARKRHRVPVPVLGGVFVFASAAAGVALAALWIPEIRIGAWGSSSIGVLGAGIFAMLALGLVDDTRELRATLKLAGQIAIAVATWALGFRIESLELPLGWVLDGGELVSLLLTVTWIVVVTNAFNLIDGLDGLATGIGVIAVLTIFLLGSESGQMVPVVGALALAGSLAGFLRYNLPPARVFLGDAGAMSIGYTAAVLSLASYHKSPTAMVVAVPLFVLGVPVLDTLLAIVRRAIAHLRSSGLRGLRPAGLGRALFEADRGHLHHLLLRAGWSVRGVLFGLYTLSGLLATLALWSRRAGSGPRWGSLLLLMVLSVAALRALQRRVERLEGEQSESWRSDDSVVQPPERRAG